MCGGGGGGGGGLGLAGRKGVILRIIGKSYVALTNEGLQLHPTVDGDGQCLVRFLKMVF